MPWELATEGRKQPAASARGLIQGLLALYCLVSKKCPLRMQNGLFRATKVQVDT